MKSPINWAGIGFLILAATAHAGPRTSTDYTVPADTADAGGQRATSTAYTNDGSLGGITGISTVASPAQTAKAGYLAQLTEVTALQVAATPATVDETATRQLSAAQLLDDDSLNLLSATEVTWSVQGGPLSGIDTSGLATADAVYQDDPIRVHARANVQSDVLSSLEASVLSARSQVNVTGYLPFPESPDSLSLLVDAPSLALADLILFEPDLNRESVLAFDGRVTGTWNRLAAHLSGMVNGSPFLSADIFYGKSEDGLDASGSFRIPELRPASILTSLDTALDLISAEGRFDVAGPDMAALTGEVELSGRHISSGSRPLVEELRLLQTFDRGLGDVDLYVRNEAGNLSMNGQIRPFTEADAEPTWDLSAEFELDDFAKTGLLDSPYLAASGRAVSRRSRGENGVYSTSSSIELSRGQIGLCDVGSGTIRHTMAGGDMQANVDLSVCDTGVLAGVWRLAGESWTGAVNLERVPYMALAGDTTRTLASGHIDIRGSLSANSPVSGTAALTDAVYGVWAADSLDAAFDYGGERVRLELDLRTDSSHVTGVGAATWNETSLTVSASELKLSRLNLDALDRPGLEDSAPVSNITGEGRFSVTLADDDMLTTDGDFRLSTSVFNDALLPGGQIRWSSAGPFIDFDATLRLDRDESDAVSESVSASGRVRRDIDEFTVENMTGTLEGLDLAGLTGNPALSSRINGSFDAAGTVDAGSASFLLSDGTRLSDLQINHAESELNWNSRTVDVDLSMRATNGTLTARGDIGRIDTVASRLTFAVRDLDIGAVAGRFLRESVSDSSRSTIAAAPDSVRASRLTVLGSVEGRPGSQAYWLVTADSVSASWEGLQIESGSMGGRLMNGVVSVDTTHIAGNFGTIDISGDIDLREERTGNRTLSAQVGLFTSDGLGPLAPFLPLSWGHLDGTVSLISGPNSRRFESSMVADNLHYGDVRVAHAESEGRGELGPDFALVAAELEAALEVVSASRFVAELMEVDIEYVDQEFATTIGVRIDRNRRVDAGFLLDTTSDPILLSIEDLSMDLDQELWQLVAPSEIVLGPVPSVRGLILASETGRIIANSVRNPSGELILLNVEDLNLASFSELLFLDGLGGVMNARMILTPPDPENPDASFEVDGTVMADISSFGREVGSITTRLDTQGPQFRVSADMQHLTGNALTLTGSIDTRDQTLPNADSTYGAVRIAMSASDFPIAWTLPFLDQNVYDHISGLLSSDLTISGTWDQPEATGDLTLREGAVGMIALGKRGRGLLIDEIDMNMSLRRDSVLLDSFTAHSGGGTVTGHGSVALTELALGEFAIDLTAEDFTAINNPIYHAVLNGTGHLKGRTDAPILSGEIEMREFNYELTSEAMGQAFDPVTLSDQDILDIERSFGILITETDTSTFDLYNALTIEDLTVELSRDSWLRSKSTPNMDIQFTGNLDISKEAFQDPIVFGQIDVISERSSIRQFGRKFRITRGLISLNGPIDNPVMDLEATYVVPSRSSSASEVTIRLLINGELQNMTLTFESDPHMELEDVVSYIVTGRPANEGLRLGQGEGGYGGTAAALASGPMSALAESIAGESLGLDVVEIAYDANIGLTITGGKYLSPELYVAVSQPLTTTSGTDSGQTGSERYTIVSGEYEILSNTFISITSEGQVIRYLIRWRYDF